MLSGPPSLASCGRALRNLLDVHVGPRCVISGVSHSAKWRDSPLRRDLADWACVVVVLAGEPRRDRNRLLGGVAESRRTEGIANYANPGQGSIVPAIAPPTIVLILPTWFADRRALRA